jgi:uncharacterized protein YeaO (DUF488 family)
MGKGTSATPLSIRIHRIEEGRNGAPGGYRVLVDAAWPLNSGSEGLPIDDWMPELGPTDWLASTFGADRARWGTFRSRYRRQLRSQGRRRRLEAIAGIARHRPVTLVTACPPSACNPAVVIREILLSEIFRPATR